MLVGQGQKFELWDDAKWQAQTAQTIAFPRRASARARRLLPLIARCVDAACEPCCEPRSRPARRERRRHSIVRPDGIYVDATFGRGGHARAILAALAGRGAARRDRSRSAGRTRRAVRSPIRASLSVARGFSELPQVLADLEIARVDGVLLDLGISSPQIDDPARGFSFRFDGPLDMRMDPTRGESAAEFLARATMRELTEVIRDYGEERFAQSIARAIVAARAVAARSSAHGSWPTSSRKPSARARGVIGVRIRPARTFQALRIFVNRELDELAVALPAVVPLLASGGRLAVISFHSLEDRIVKRFIAWASQPFGGDPRLARLAIRDSALPRHAAGRDRPRDQALGSARSRPIRARAARSCASPSARRMPLPAAASVALTRTCHDGAR